MKVIWPTCACRCHGCVSQALKPEVWLQMCPSVNVPQPFLFHILNSTQANTPSSHLCAFSAGLQQKQAAVEVAALPGLYLSVTHAGHGGPAVRGLKGKVAGDI